MMFRVLTIATFAFPALAGCASTPGSRPTDMSAAQHEHAAAAEETQAASHSEQYSPGAQATPENSSAQCAYTLAGCWSSSTNPTQEHQADAEKHRKAAADHRAASTALRDAEAWACAGVSEPNRDMSPFGHREDIIGVQPAYVHVTGKEPRDEVVGAVVTFRALPGMTGEWLQRVIDCHIARNNALGNDVPEMPDCPLVPKGVTATVSSAGGGFAVRIESQDPHSAKEILRRAELLKPAR